MAAEQAQDKGLAVTCGTVEGTETVTRFDTITAFDVLEHVLDPLAFAKAIHERLLSGGTVAISVPNLNSLSRRLMRQRWYFYIPKEHLHYFSPSSLSRLLRRAGFEVFRCRPTYKPLTFDYSLVQFREYNPWIYRALNVVAKVLPKSLRSVSVPLYIGETMVIARKL